MVFKEDDLTEEDIQLLYALESRKLPKRLAKATNLVITLLDESIDLYERIYETRKEEAVINAVKAYFISLAVNLAKRYGIKPIAKALAEMYEELAGSVERNIAYAIKKELDELKQLRHMTLKGKKLDKKK